MDFTKQATQQLAPAFTQQQKALQSRIPALQKLYSSLFQALRGQQAQASLGGYEAASGRGLLRSTIGTDIQTGIGQQFAQQRGQIAQQQGQEIGQVNSDLAGLGIQRAQAIASLADTLSGRYLQRQELTSQQQAQRRQLDLQRQIAEREFRQKQSISDRQYQQQQNIANKRYELAKRGVYY